MKKVLSLLSAVFIVMLTLGSLAAAADQAGPRATLDLSGHPFKGPANAPVTVVVFSDYF